MKILDLGILGYRSLKDVSWKPGSLNVLIGPNGSGKSNLLRALEMISISARGQLGKHVQRLGGMEPLVWDGKAASLEFVLKISGANEQVSFEWNEETFGVEDGGNFEWGDGTYSMVMGRLGKSSSYRINREELELRIRYRDGFRLDGKSLRVIDRDSSHSAIRETPTSLLMPQENIKEEESVLSLTSEPFTQKAIATPFCKYLAGWAIYHDFHVNLDAPVRQAVVARHETRVDPDGQNLISVLHTLYTGDREFKNDINLAMRAAFGDDFEELVFPPAADQRVQLRVRWKSLSREQSAADLSDGTLRFLFLLAILASPSPAPLIAIDEPETGLHPSMLPIIAEYAADAAERTQVILTTHSPEFLDAFDDIRPQVTVVAVLAGKTSLTNLEGPLLDRWLAEYSLGSLQRSGELENVLPEMIAEEQVIANRQERA